MKIKYSSRLLDRINLNIIPAENLSAVEMVKILSKLTGLQTR